MLSVGRNELRVPYGDTLNITFSVRGYQVMEGDVAVLTVKRSMRDPQPLLEDETVCTSEGVAMADVPAAKMAELPPGRYVYDVYLKRGDSVVTITPPSVLVIEEVVHRELPRDDYHRPQRPRPPRWPLWTVWPC